MLAAVPSEAAAAVRLVLVAGEWGLGVSFEAVGNGRFWIWKPGGTLGSIVGSIFSLGYQDLTGYGFHASRSVIVASALGILWY